MDYAIRQLYHPSHRVPDLKAAEKFFNEIFGFESVWRSSLYRQPDPKHPTYPTDYCLFTGIADVFFDCIDPEKYVIDGIQRYESVSEPHLNGLGWAVEGIEALYSKIYREMGIRCTDQANRLSDPDLCPKASFKDSHLFYTVAEDSGVRYEFYPTTSIGSYDHRQAPGWKLKPEEGKGFLGIQFCAYHTILTDRKERAVSLYVGVLGGKVIHEESNKVRGTDSTFVQLTDAIFEFATPIDPSSYAMVDFQSRKNKSEDMYHSLTWKVKDLDVVKQHLTANGVKILAQSDDLIITDAHDGLGIPWGFVKSVVPNDTRHNLSI